MSSILACGKIPALAQSTSMPPFRRAALFAIFSNSARLVTSAMAALTSPPTSSATAFDSAWWRATLVTFAPFLAKTCAMPLPIPLLALVTTDFPAIDVSMRPSLGRSGRFMPSGALVY